MDKYEYKVRADEIKELIDRGEYVQAADIADTIDWRRVKSVMMLCTISDLYKMNRRYEDARDMLLLAYERRPGGRTICYSLCELSIKMEEFVQAVEYYKEFVQVAPRDSGRYILQYKLYEAQDVSLEERIAVLEELKKRDYREKWAYELAYLYHRVGLGARCVEECDELILWFGEGKYVIKAMELKMLHQPLSPDQQMKYDHRFDAVQAVQQAAENTPVYEEVPSAVEEQVLPDYTQDNEENYEDTVMPQEMQEKEEQPSVEEMDIHVKTMDVGQYNTINLQEELAAGLKKILEEEQAKGNADSITRSIFEPMLDSDTETLDYPEIDEVSEDDLEPTVEEMEGTEVFFGETGEIGTLHDRNTSDIIPDITKEMIKEQLRQVSAQVPVPAVVPEISENVSEELEELEELEESEATVQSNSQISHVELPEELANVLSQQPDGQISLVIPENESVEKQITGQMNLEDILTEWERMKTENLEKRQQEVRQQVLRHTGSMFTEFEESLRDGLLEQLEEEKNTASTEVNKEPEVPIEAAEVQETIQKETVMEDVMEDVVTDTDEVEELEEIIETPVEEESYTETMTESTYEEDATSNVYEQEQVIEREQVRVRALTQEERELFAPFVQSRSAREQLVNAIDNISMAAYTGNVIVTGEEGMDTLTLAKNMIREIQAADSNFSGKVAKISGQALNKKDVAETIEKLKNGALIVTKASGISVATAMDLHKILQKESLGIIVVLEDTKKAMDYFLSENEQLKSSFTARMDMEALSNETLVAFGRQYAREKEYSIDDLGVLALHTRIEDLQTIDHVVTVVEVKRIVDDAIRHANRKTVGHFIDILLAKRYDDEDMIILSEKDFVI